MSWRQFVLTEKTKIIKTGMVSFSFVIFAVSVILPGTALLDLQIKVQESFAVASRILTTRSIGYIIGAVLVGILEGFCNTELSLASALLLFGIPTIIAPFMTSFILMSCCTFLMGLGQAIFDMMSHVYLFELWKEKSANPLQLLHMSFGIGAVIGPLITRPFMLPVLIDLQEDPSKHEVHIQHLTPYRPEDVIVHWPFLIAGVVSLGCAFCFMGFFISSRGQEKAVEEKCKQLEEEKKCNSKWKQIILIFLISVIAHVIFGTGLIISGFSQAYGMKSMLHMEKKLAALLPASFWVMFIFGRASFVIMTLFLEQLKVAGLHVILTVSSIVILFIFGTWSQLSLWLFFLIYGFGHSPLWGLALSIPSRYMRFTGRHTSIIFLWGVVGEALHPQIVSWFMDDKPEVFIYYLGTLVTIFTGLTTSVIWFAPKFFEPKDSGTVYKNSEMLEKGNQHMREREKEKEGNLSKY